MSQTDMSAEAFAEIVKHVSMVRGNEEAGKLIAQRDRDTLTKAAEIVDALLLEENDPTGICCLNDAIQAKRDKFRKAILAPLAEGGKHGG